MKVSVFTHMKPELPCALDELSAKQPRDSKREAVLLCCLLCSSEGLVELSSQEQRTEHDLLQDPHKL